VIGIKITITAALPYANGPLHLGHIRSTYLPADIYARYQRLAGNDAVYICASDEHGTPIVAAAEKEKKKPEEFVRYYHERDKNEFEKLGFRMDIFHRTSSQENREMAQHFFLKLKEKNLIYEKEVEQAYCERCKRFLPDRFVIGRCPYCNAAGQYSDYCDACGKALAAGELLEPKCSSCNSTPTTKKSRHYFFKLSQLSPKLEQWLKENKELQSEVVNYLLNWIKEGLRDWDISRDMEWGVPIPSDKGKVLYVWFDAPIGYVSSTVAWANQNGKDWEDYWKKDCRIVHFIGKDIVYHHYLFWPAMLMEVGEGFKPPDAIPTRGYLNLQGRKFSKSKNWFVSLEDYLNAFPADYLRYYVTTITPHSVQDADFYWKDFQEKVNNELLACIGNFIHRALVLVNKSCNSQIPEPLKLDEREEKLLKLISEKKETVGRKIDLFNFKEGLEEINSLASEFNRYLSEREPWKEKDKQKLGNCLYVCSRAVTALAVLLSPYLPFSSEKLLTQLGIDEKITWEHVDKELLPVGKKIATAKPLFEKVSDENIKKQEEKLRK
jgi:methionyl-tRNA synthetase